MVEIRFATVADIRPLMSFMHEHWRADHILSRDETLFRFDFQDGDRLNLAVACNPDNRIVGLFGFIKYSGLDRPDIAGSLWKVVDGLGPPMLGLQLRRFVIDNVPHRFFAAPGAGLQTRPIYRLIGMDWIEMEHFYFANPDIHDHRLCRVNVISPDKPSVSGSTGYEFAEIVDPNHLADFPFLRENGIGPLKDWAYLARRFFAHPIYRYRVFRLSRHSEPVDIVVCREVFHDGAKALRVVDFYGEERHMSAVVASLFEVMRRDGLEYVDFVCSGFDQRVMSAAGWQRLDFGSNDTVVPNYFEPFTMCNVRVYAVADSHPTISPRLCRADGDQDRPNCFVDTSLDVAS